MFTIPAELEEAHDKQAAIAGGMDAAAPLPVDLVCKGVWGPVQQVSIYFNAFLFGDWDVRWAGCSLSG